MLNRSKKFLACPPSHTHHFLNGREALAGSARASSPAPKQMDSLNLVDQLSQLLAGIKHAGLHGGGGNAEDVCGVLHRLLVSRSRPDKRLKHVISPSHVPPDHDTGAGTE